MEQAPWHLSILAVMFAILGVFISWIIAAVGMALAVLTLLRMRTQPSPFTAIMPTICLIVAALGLLTSLARRPYVFAAERSKSVSCQANLRQLMLAMSAYAADYDGHEPGSRSWCDATLPYLGARDVFSCPARSRWRCGYACGQWMDRLRVQGLERPGQLSVLFDAAVGSWNAFGTAALADERHQHGLNVGFADGHAAWSAGLVEPDGAAY